MKNPRLLAVLSRVDITDWIPGRQNNEQLRESMKLDPPEFRQELPLEELTFAAGYYRWKPGKCQVHAPGVGGVKKLINTAGIIPGLH